MRRRWTDRRVLAAAYVVLLVASWLAQQASGPAGFTPRGATRSSAVVGVPGVARRGSEVLVSWLEWGAGEGGEGDARPVVILLHGSPGWASDFARLGPALARRGLRAIAIDMPGFARSARARDIADFSIHAYARTVLAWMDEVGLERANVVGWSNGGGTALWMNELAPRRVESLTLVAAIGAQEFEGSGNHGFEHAKYALGYAAVVLVPEVVPHFGLLGPRSDRAAFIRNFWDSDQRPLGELMGRVATPTLVLHGWSDFLVPSASALDAHARIGPSRLVMMDASHFIPFLQVEGSAEEIDAHVRAARAGGFARARVDRATEPPNPLGRFGRAVESWLGSLAWWGVLLIVASLAGIWPRWGLVIGAYLVWRVRLDPGVLAAALALGHAAETAGMWSLGRLYAGRARVPRALLDYVEPMHETYWAQRMGTQRALRWTTLVTRFQPWARRAAAFCAGRARRGSGPTALIVVVGGVLWSLGATITAIPVVAVMAGLGSAIGAFGGAVGVVLGLACAMVIVRAGELSTTWAGRRRLLAWLTRVRRFEYWPGWIAYAPLGPWLVAQAIRRRGALVFTCANPGIAEGGGIVGESKTKILGALAAGGAGIVGGERGAVLASALVPAGPDWRARADEARRLVETRSELGGYPVICKPDAAQRGFAVRLVRAPEEFEACFSAQSRDAIVQRYHPGPCECGLMWVRDPEPGAGRAGRIFSITRKEFPVVEGDGRSTLEELIYAHRRFRCQCDVFLQRFAPRRLEVLAPGERLRLSQSGNHCQGTLFRDGSDLITPALEDRIDAIARGFGGGNAGGGGGGSLDFGRFDLRYESDEALREGQGFGIVELNGTTGESTNIYDPDRSVWWAYGVLFRQWSVMYAIGVRRRREGVRALSPMELIGLIRGYYRDRPGSAIAD